MNPPNLGQALDDNQPPNQELDPDEVNGNEIDEDRLFSGKSPSQINVIGQHDIIHDDGMKNLVKNDFLYNEDSVDSSMDSPDSILLTDSGEELTDNENPLPAQQSLGAVPERTVNSNSFWEYSVQSSNAPSRRRPLHEINTGIPQHKEQNFLIGKDKINELIEKFHDKVFINKELSFILMALFVILLSLIYHVLPVNETSPKSTQYYISDEILNQYPTQDKIDLRNLVRVIYNVKQGKHETDKVAVITILYSHRETAECLAKTTANYAVRVINRNEDFVRLNGSLSNDNFYLGNENFKKDIEGRGVLVVYDFHNFPAEKVRYFHAIFDKHSPYIEDKAVYIILLEMSKNQEKISKKLEKVQSRIEELWSILRSEILNPLGTRLMENVMVVQRESHLLC